MTENRRGGTLAVAREYDITDYVINKPVIFTDPASVTPVFVVDCQNASRHLVTVHRSGATTGALSFQLYGRLKKGLDVNDLESIDRDDGTWINIGNSTALNYSTTNINSYNKSKTSSDRWRYLLIIASATTLNDNAIDVYYRGTS